MKYLGLIEGEKVINWISCFLAISECVPTQKKGQSLNPNCFSVRKRIRDKILSCLNLFRRMTLKFLLQIPQSIYWNFWKNETRDNSIKNIQGWLRQKIEKKTEKYFFFWKFVKIILPFFSKEFQFQFHAKSQKIKLFFILQYHGEDGNMRQQNWKKKFWIK